MLLRARIWVFLAISVLSLNQLAQAVERTEVAEKYRWDLSAPYPGASAWAAARQDFVKSAHRGGLAQTCAKGGVQ